jgi:hypothetical protein
MTSSGYSYVTPPVSSVTNTDATATSFPVDTSSYMTSGLTQTTFETSVSSTKSGYAMPPEETYEPQSDKVKRGMVSFPVAI